MRKISINVIQLFLTKPSWYKITCHSTPLNTKTKIPALPNSVPKQAHEPTTHPTHLSVPPTRERFNGFERQNTHH